MKIKIELWFRRQLSRFLGWFPEVRRLRTLQAGFNDRCQEHFAEELKSRKAAEQAEIAKNRTLHELEEMKRALSLMTEARLQADRAVEVLRGQMASLQECTEREIANMKQMVDWFGLEGRGRQVFGTAPLQNRATSTEEVQPQVGLRGRQAVEILTRESFQKTKHDLEEFYKAAQKASASGEPLPNGGPEYSSTSHAVA